MAPSSPDWKQLLEVGMQFTELRRSQARRIAADLVAQGQLARDQVGGAVEEIVEMSRRRTEEMRAVVRSEVQRQLGALGLATKDDLARLEARVRPPAKRAGTAKAPARSGTTKAATKKAAKSATKVAKKKGAAKVVTRAATKTAARPSARGG
jgi:polyhydroxyalkanoate synthesis regulator phasin